MFTPAELPIGDEPTCGTDDVMILMAQAVPTATAVPCVAALPAGWDVGGVAGAQRRRARSGSTPTSAGDHAVEVTLRPPDECDVDGATEVPSDEVGHAAVRAARAAAARRCERRARTCSTAACVTYRFDFDGDVNASVDGRRSTRRSRSSRASELVAEVERRSGLALCGAGAPPCAGATR